MDLIGKLTTQPARIGLTLISEVITKESDDADRRDDVRVDRSAPIDCAVVRAARRVSSSEQKVVFSSDRFGC